MSHHLQPVDVPVRVLLRGADVEDRGLWQGPADFRPLSASGWSQAADVVAGLGGLGVRWLLSSPSLHCRQTLLAAASTLELDIEPHADLGAGGSRDGLIRLLMSPEADGSVLCSHADVIDDVLDRLPGLRIVSRRPTEPAGYWLIRGQAGGGVARYCAPARSASAPVPHGVAVGS